MEKPAAERGRLAGLPVPIKDLTNVAGVLTTQGSPIFRDSIPAKSDILVEHLEANGGVIYAKSNTPEFGAGANTFNEVFGPTLNPWDISRSAAGSSGGAAVALATGTAWLAHGTDMGGSLRNPASFCGIVGLRPSIGRVAHTPSSSIDRNLTVHGPMARNVEDLALLLDAMSGEHAADPLSLPVPPASFLSAARSGRKPKRIAYSPDLGITPVDPEVAAITRKAAERFAEAGAIVEEAHPDLREAHECFHVLRAFDFAMTKAALLRTKRDLLKPEVIWNVEEGLKLTVEQIARAEAQRVEMTARTIEFFKSYDLLLAPATIVAPFPIEQRYVAECAGKNSTITWNGSASSMRLRWRAVRPCRCRADLPPRACRSGCRWWPRRGARRNCSPAPRCWRMFWASAAPPRLTRASRNSATAWRRFRNNPRTIRLPACLSPRPRELHGGRSPCYAACGRFRAETRN
jgi:amidase